LTAGVEDCADAGVAAEHVFLETGFVDVDGDFFEGEFVDLKAKLSG
jgi:hypothetical protein